MSHSAQIEVAIRMRPFLPSDPSEEKNAPHIEMDEKNCFVKIQNEKNSTQKEYKFSKLFCTTATQEEVFIKCNIPMLITKVVEGYHSTIFAYGHTGAGKTFTMEGTNLNAKRNLSSSEKAINNEGIIGRSIKYLFNLINQKSEKRKYIVFCSYLQIYNERILDLLNNVDVGSSDSVKAGLKLRFKNGFFAVENLYTVECKNENDVFDLLNYGRNNRVVAATKYNHVSSRSHSIFTLTVESIEEGVNDSSTISKLQLVDLAGSERGSINPTSDKLQKESIEINKSLFTLRQVILTLNEAQTHGKNVYIPYRDSKLTSILSQSIGGNTFSLMISCISPCHSYIEDNISTLNYTSKASFISNKPVVNQDSKILLINELKIQVKELTKQLKEANDHIQFLTSLTNQNVQQSKINDNIILNGSNENRVNINNNFNSNQITVNNNCINQDESLIKDIKSPDKITKQIFNDPIGFNLEELGLKAKGILQFEEGINFDKDQMINRIVQSVNMVKEVLQSNIKLRDQVQELSKIVERQETDISYLTQENVDIKETLTLIKEMNKSEECSGNKGNEISPLEKLNIAEEMLQLRKGKDLLEKRVKTLEKDSIQFRASQQISNNNNNNNGNNNYKKIDVDFEPVRSIVNANDFTKNQNLPKRKHINSINSKTSYYHNNGNLQDSPDNKVSNIFANINKPRNTQSNPFQYTNQSNASDYESDVNPVLNDPKYRSEMFNKNFFNSTNLHFSQRKNSKSMDKNSAIKKNYPRPLNEIIVDKKNASNTINSVVPAKNNDPSNKSSPTYLTTKKRIIVANSYLNNSAIMNHTDQ